MKNTLIEWEHHTENFWWGCDFKRYLDGTVREECQHCYALTLSKIFSRGQATWGPTGQRWLRHEAAARSLAKLDATGARFVHKTTADHARLGKKSAGRLLDGREHNAFPSP